MTNYQETTDLPFGIHNSFTLTDGDTFSGAFSAPGDGDWLPIQMEIDRTYIVEFESTFPRPVLDIVNSSGNEVSSSESSISGNTMVFANAQASGLHYIQLFDRFSTEGSYEIKISSEVANNKNTQINLPLDFSSKTVATYTGTTEYLKDTDWLEVEFIEGHSYAISILDSVGSSFVSVVNSAGNAQPIETGAFGVGNDFTTFTPNATGIFYIQYTTDINVLRPQPANGLSYQVTIEKDPAPNPKTAYSIEHGETVSLDFDFFSDDDWFKTNLESGYTYIVVNTIDSSFTRYTNFVNADGSSAVSAINFSSSDTFDIIAPVTTGEYFIQTGSDFPISGGELSLTRETGNDNSTKAKLSLNKSIEEKFDYNNDIDVFALDVVAGQKYSITAALNGNSTNRIDFDLRSESGDLLLPSQSASEGVVKREYVAEKSETIYVYLDEADSAVGLEYSLSVSGSALLTQEFIQVVNTNSDTVKGIAIAYSLLLDGVPNQAGFTFLINSATSTNFGAGPGPSFNSENIFINLVNNLVQGNSEAETKFNTIATGTTLAEKITSIYRSIIPTQEQSDAGLNFITRAEGILFYQNVAAERGVEGTDGAAIIAMASLLKITVDGNIGIGNAVNDFLNAISMGSAILPEIGTELIPLETADGTAFDSDDASTSRLSYDAPATDDEVSLIQTVGTVDDPFAMV